MRLPLLIFFSGLVFSASWLGCGKDSLEQLHIDTLISNNEPPPYSGVSAVQINNYINRLYIDLLGRAPDQAEIANGLNFLVSHDLSDASKDSLISQLMLDDDYHAVLFSNTSADFINATDSAAIDYQIAVIKFVYYIDSLDGNTQNFIYYQYELNRLYSLRDVKEDFKTGTISLNDYYAVFLDNYFYDQVNMGSENFVKGAFSDLFRRAPAQSELLSAVTMVDNNPAILFLEDGDSKGDFIRIVTGNAEFYQGIVIRMYSQLLLREATSQELSEGTQALQLSCDLPNFQKQIMKTIEYAGF